MLNRLGQVPAKGLPDFAVHRHPANRLSPTRLRAPLATRIDCGFRNLSSLGLLSGFQRPNRLSRVLPCATVGFAFRRRPPCCAGRLLYCRTGSTVKQPMLLRLSGSLRSEVRLRVLLRRRGAEPTSFPPPLSTRCVDSFSSLPGVVTRATSSGSAGGGFYHCRVSSQLRFVDLLFRLSCVVRRPPSPVRLRLPVRGGAASSLSPSRLSTTILATICHCRSPFGATPAPYTKCLLLDTRAGEGLLIHQAIGQRKLFSLA